MANEASKNVRPRYRFCWSCSRQLHGNAHRVARVDGNEVIVHAECAARDGLEVVGGLPAGKQETR